MASFLSISSIRWAASRRQAFTTPSSVSMSDAKFLKAEIRIGVGVRGVSMAILRVLALG